MKYKLILLLFTLGIFNSAFSIEPIKMKAEINVIKGIYTAVSNGFYLNKIYTDGKPGNITITPTGNIILSSKDWDVVDKEDNSTTFGEAASLVLIGAPTTHVKMSFPSSIPISDGISASNITCSTDTGSFTTSGTLTINESGSINLRCGLTLSLGERYEFKSYNANIPVTIDLGE